MLDNAHVEAAASGEERPYAALSWQQLRKIAEESWDDAIILYSVWREADHRVRRNPASKSQSVIDVVQSRLVALVQNIFPPEPDPTLGDRGMDSSTWPKQGLLKRMGYTTGYEDPGWTKRRKILRQAFFGPIPDVVDADYMHQWGRHRSAARLQKLAWSIAAFINNRIRRNGGADDLITKKWRDDLQWLKRELYEGYFEFPWPVPGVKW